MLPINFGFDAATSLNASGLALKGGGVTPTETEPALFQNILRDAAALKTEATANPSTAHGQGAVKETDRGATAAARAEAHAKSTPRHGEDAVKETDRGATAAARVEAHAKSRAAHGEGAVNESDRSCAADDNDTQPTHRSAANENDGQPVWALLAQIIQNLTAAGETKTTAVEVQGDAVASDPEAGDAAEELNALVDLLKQLQENPAAVTAESAIPLDRLRQMLEQWQAGANASQPAGLPGRLLDLLKNVQEALPGIAWDRWAAAMASQDGAVGKVPLEALTPAGAGPISAAGSQHDGLPVSAGRAVRGALLDTKNTPVAAGKADDAVSADERSDRGRPAADERSPGAGRVLPAALPATSPPAETLRSTAVASKAQALEGSFVHVRNLEVKDTQPDVSGDSRSPADKATAGIAHTTADQLVEEGDSPSLRFDAALRDARSFAVPEGNPDKTAETAAPAKSRDTAAAPVKADVFDQIVQRAAVQVKNNQGEIRIDLKPEFLGNVRLQIVTDNQQVTVRILTELPMVRDMIESSIQQLKSDLQQQGLQVARVEVAVADDPRQHQGRQTRKGDSRKGHTDGDIAPAADETSARLRPEAAYRWGQGGQATINMFA